MRWKCSWQFTEQFLINTGIDRLELLDLTFYVVLLNLLKWNKVAQ